VVYGVFAVWVKLKQPPLMGNVLIGECTVTKNYHRPRQTVCGNFIL